MPEAGSTVGYDRYAYVYNNPINLNDPTGNRACDDYYSSGCRTVLRQSGTSSATSTTSTTSTLPTTVLINTCGWGTGLSCSDTLYDGQKPLSPVATAYQEWSNGEGTIIWNGFNGSGDPKKVDEGEKIYQQIVDEISKNKNALIFMVAHSAGTDATIYALSLLAERNPEMMDNIVKVAILDVDLAPNPEITNEMGRAVNEKYTGRIFYGGSVTYLEFYIDLGSTVPQFLANESGAFHHYNLNHTQLAVDSAVMQDIIAFFGW